jgi:predicted transcriptional regulator of viral defense system
MGSSTDQSLAGRAWALAAKQHGVVSRRQLLELGLGAQSIQHRLERGRLHRIDRGVYAVGRPALGREGRWMAAVLACGPGAVLSHGSAAALWRIGPSPPVVEVTIPVASPRRRNGVRVHRRPNLLAAHATVRNAIPVTKPVRTAIDLAVRLGPAQLERLINEADRIGLFSPEDLLAKLDDYPGAPGVGPLRTILGHEPFGSLIRSWSDASCASSRRRGCHAR